MGGPFTYIGTYRIQDGKLEETRRRLAELVDLVETNEPRLIAFNVYLDEEGRRASVVQVHPDADSMAFHIGVVSEHLSSAFDYLESTESEQFYGAPSDSLAAALQRFAQPDVPVTLMPRHEVGFTRTNAR